MAATTKRLTVTATTVQTGQTMASGHGYAAFAARREKEVAAIEEVLGTNKKEKDHELAQRIWERLNR
jgi:hypothetical protein